MLILVPKVTNRLQYTFDFVFGTVLGMDFELTTKKESFRDFEGRKMSYGPTPLWDEPFQKSVNMLFERDIYEQDLKPFDFKTALVLASGILSNFNCSLFMSLLRSIENP